MAKGLMFQGTASDSGKSTIVAGFCRIYKEKGYKVFPFKSQNMALNSYITPDGKEMGRAQVFQAEAAGRIPDVRMNPILLKPSSEDGSQVIINGKVEGQMRAAQYYEYKQSLIPVLDKIYREIQQENDIILLEGAGSPAEINLKENDIVNMGMAKIADVPVILVADIDKGGVFASIYGTVMLLEAEERARIKGIIINKFRGDVTLLEPGIRQIEELVGIPVVGVVPYLDIDIDPEDSISLVHKPRHYLPQRPIHVAVILLSKISNFTDIHYLELIEDVTVKYVLPHEKIGEADIIILPGTKSSIHDCQQLHQTGMAQEIVDLAKRGSRVIGICGGYQILGEQILDPLGIESTSPSVKGLGLLPMETIFEKEKTMCQIEGVAFGHKICGYEIHMGQSYPRIKEENYFSRIEVVNGKKEERVEGMVSKDERIFGTYVHGILDNETFVKMYLDKIRQEKGLPIDVAMPLSLQAYKEREYNKLAKGILASCDMEKIEEILGL